MVSQLRFWYPVYDCPKISGHNICIMITILAVYCGYYTLIPSFGQYNGKLHRLELTNTYFTET